MNPRSKYANTPRTTTKRLPRMTRRKAGGDVPIPQLYRDIDAGWRYFLANRIERETLKGAPVRIR